jgi:hypothetical protein
VKVTAIAPAPAVATLGAASELPGVRAIDMPDATLVSPLPLGVTVNLYDVVLERPVTMQFDDVLMVSGVALTTVQVGPAVA